MANFTNRNKITTMSASSVDTGVQDGIDHIHSGLIKVLDAKARGNYVFECGDIQQASGSARTKFGFLGASNTVKYYVDGVYTELTSDLYTPDINSPEANDRYDLMVINGGSLYVRTGTASTSPKVADLNDGDVPVALIKVAKNTGDNIITRPVQLFTYDKNSDSTTIGYGASTYTKTMLISGSADGTTFDSDAGKIIMKQRDDSNVGFEVVNHSGNPAITAKNQHVGIGGTEPTYTLHVERGESGNPLGWFSNNPGGNDGDGVFIRVRTEETNDALRIIGRTGSTDATNATIDGSGHLTCQSVIIGGDADGTDRTITFGHATLKTTMGISDTLDTFIINTDEGFDATLANNSLTIDGSDNVGIGGDLTVNGGDIIGPTDGALTIKADTDMIFRIDSDNDGAETFQFQSNNGNEIMSLDEAGNLQIDGDLDISGGNLATTAVTADLVFTTAGGLNNAASTSIANSGSYKMANDFRAGLTATEAAAMGSPAAPVGDQNKILHPNLATAIDPSNILDLQHEVIYIGTNNITQVGATEYTLGGGSAGTEYLAMLEGTINGAPSNGLIGGGGFIVIPNPADHVDKKVTLVNTTNLPCHVLCLQQGVPNGLYAGFHKGYAGQDWYGTYYNQDTCDINRQIESNHLATLVSGGTLVGAPSTGENCLILRPHDSITIHSVQLMLEGSPDLNNIQVAQGWHNAAPNAYWMVISKATNSNLAQIKMNTTQIGVMLSVAQSGQTLIANRAGGAGANPIYLPPTPKVGTQFLIVCMQACTVIACDPLGGGHIFEAGGAPSSDVINWITGNSVTDVLAAGDMVTYIYGPDMKWLKVG